MKSPEQYLEEGLRTAVQYKGGYKEAALEAIRAVITDATNEMEQVLNRVELMRQKSQEVSETLERIMKNLRSDQPG